MRRPRTSELPIQTSSIVNARRGPKSDFAKIDGEVSMRMLLTFALIVAVPAAATAADDQSTDSGSSPVARPAPGNPVQPYIYQPYGGEGWLERYQYERAIREQDKEEKKQWDNYAKKNALPIARPNEPPSDESISPTDTPPQGFKIVHPPETTSSIASDKARDLAEPFSLSDPPPKRRDRLW
jgi:hypothetical protein